MDLRLPDGAGVRMIEQLTLIAPASRILILTRTEQNRVASILAKLHLDNRIQAAVQAVRSGIS